MLQILMLLFEANRNRENSVPMQKYMKNHFPFLGIKTPRRRELMKEFYQQSSILKQDFQEDFVAKLWELEEREYQYAALDYMERSLKKLGKSHLPFCEKLITTKSWWDSVDVLAPKPVGTIAAKFPEVIPKTIDGWAESGHLWLTRAAILFQLKYKEKTDETLLYRYILQNNDSGEFFIEKAIGWILREYSKTNHDSVKSFIKSHDLPKLSVREGSKYIK
jgi:3-methyladenine DNA glycosylase AlkD